MNDKTPIERAHWSSMTSYLLVTSGAVIGLGNVFQFPYFVSQFGGLFVLFYIACELLVSLPILFAELVIGRRGKQNPVGSISILSLESGASHYWRWIGWLCFIILFLSLAHYTFVVAYPVMHFANIIQSWTENTVTFTSTKLEICLIIFLFATFLVILRGINRGLETISRFTVPAYFIILSGLAIYSCTQGNFINSLRYLVDLHPDNSVYSVFFAALTYAFFKLNVGMGSMIVYGSYLPYSVPIGRSTLIIIFFDAIISLLAYFVLYPLQMNSHEALSVSSNYYDNVSAIFSSIPHGSVIGGLFFIAAIMAAWTPTIAMAESATVILIERFNLSRCIAALIVFFLAFVIGTAIIFSHHQLSATVNRIDAHVLIPLSALLIAIFAGWIIKKNITSSELGFNRIIYSIWLFLIRFVAPIVIVGIVYLIHFR